MFDTIQEIIDYSNKHDMSFAEIMIQDEMERSGQSREEVREQMKQNLK